MSWLLPPLPPHFEAALRDVRAKAMEARMAAARRLSQPDAGQEQEAREALITLTRDRDARVRATAVEGLTEVGNAEDHGRLLECLDDDDPLVRELSVVALSTIEHAARDELLLGALESRHPEVRFQALSCCAEQCADVAAVHFTRLTRDDDARVRQNAARILGETGAAASDEPTRQRLRGMLGDDDGGVRYRAALSLGEHATADAIHILVEAVDNPVRRLDALDALGAHDTPQVRAAAAAVAESFLKPLAIKAAAARTLCRLGDPRGAQALGEVLSAFRGDARSYAVEIVGELRLSELAPALEQLARRPRGVDPTLLLDALERLAGDSAAARRGLSALSEGSGDMAGRAREALAGLAAEDAADPPTTQ